MHSLHAPWMAWWLAMALVLAPALGRMHEVLHAPTGFALSSTAAHASPSSSSNASAHQHVDSISAWFAGHNALDCQVFDHLAQGHSGPAPLLAMHHSLPDSAPVWHDDGAPRPAASPMFLARAPPERFMA